MYLFSFIILCLLFYALKTVSKKGFVDITRQKILWNHKGQDCLFYDQLIHPLPSKSVSHRLSPWLPVPVLLPPFFTVLPFLQGTPQATKSKSPSIFPAVSQSAQ